MHTQIQAKQRLLVLGLQAQVVQVRLMTHIRRSVRIRDITTTIK